MPVEASPAPAVYWTPRIMTVAAPESVLSPQSFVPAGQCRSVFLAACIQQRPPGEGGSGRPHQWYSSRRAVQCRAEPSLLATQRDPDHSHHGLSRTSHTPAQRTTCGGARSTQTSGQIPPLLARVWESSAGNVATREGGLAKKN